jgi:hypothetical protein
MPDGGMSSIPGEMRGVASVHEYLQAALSPVYDIFDAQLEALRRERAELHRTIDAVIAEPPVLALDHDIVLAAFRCKLVILDEREHEALSGGHGTARRLLAPGGDFDS